MGEGTMDFYFDFSSPYAYFASTRIDALAERFGRVCRWRPMLLNPAFQASGNVRLIDQPMKGAYARHDWDRMSRLMQVPYAFPDPFPVSTVAAARAFWWLDSIDPILAKKLGRALFHGYFAEARDISQRDVVAAIGAEQGIDPAQVLGAVDDPVWKAKLRHETEGAIASGVFGAPFIVVDGEAFWGVDRLWMVGEWLERGGW
ncbi:MAG: 2-hydroxychromene-2-carboxylate isomerase [Rhodospirillaceae bacterium]|nr:2-hydroxychromene-2-carboxylate isomerase [Rhodospirillales bacterium]